MQALPIDEALPRIQAALDAQTCAVLVAPPGAGKTTRVPLALLDSAWAAGGRLIVLEPRRLAARAAAERMAQTLGEHVGATIGLRMRGESSVSAATRIEVVTEGVFTRQILADPELAGVAGVLFDEFHERSLDADLGLALALDAQSGLREDLRLLVMSATLDGARVSTLLADAPLVESAGRAFPVETRYRGRDPARRLEDDVARAILASLADEPGSVLAFLPGAAEIRRTAALLDERLADPTIATVPLFGALDRDAQRRAIEPTPANIRKVVLATSIAETSLTIQGVRIVVDSGLARVPRYRPDLDVTELETVRASRAAVDQRRGRAGRTEPGVCIRLWEEAATQALRPFERPEILSADLTGFVLDLAAWGVADPATLSWLDPPPLPTLAEARRTLQALGALDRDDRITERGKAIQALPIAPRLARMVLDSPGAEGADLAILLTERGLGGDSTDLEERLRVWRRDRTPRADTARRLVKALAARVPRRPAMPTTPSLGMLVALAYPERIARARGTRGEFLMANGRAASVEPHDALAGEPFLAVAQIVGRPGASRIVAAAALTEAEIAAGFADAIVTGETLTFDEATASLRARLERRLGALTLSSQTRPVPAGPDSALALARGIRGLGLERLPWTPDISRWRDRIEFLRAAGAGDEWPDLSDAALTASLESWLPPFIEGRTALDDITPDNLRAALEAQLTWPQGQRLAREAPSHFEAPTGTRVPIDYAAEAGPTIAIRVGELYGLSSHPSVADMRIPLTLHLLSPAQRPIQITRDLPGFWRGSWAAVRSEMKGRYPRHLWPDDPASAQPTTRAKPRGT